VVPAKEIPVAMGEASGEGGSPQAALSRGATPRGPASSTGPPGLSLQAGKERFTRFGSAGNQSGRQAPVALSSGPTSGAIFSGAAITSARVAGSFSHSANA
jgi:hypothetical protein